jgi:hypothetical protein
MSSLSRCLGHPGDLVQPALGGHTPSRSVERTYLAETDSDGALKSLQAASCTYRFALGPRAAC